MFENTKGLAAPVTQDWLQNTCDRQKVSFVLDQERPNFEVEPYTPSVRACVVRLTGVSAVVVLVKRLLVFTPARQITS